MEIQLVSMTQIVCVEIEQKVIYNSSNVNLILNV